MRWMEETYFAHMPHTEIHISTCSWWIRLMGKAAASYRGNFMWHVPWQAGKCISLNKWGQVTEVIYEKDIRKSCLHHRVARQQPEMHFHKILSDIYKSKVLFLLISMRTWSLAYIPPFIEPTLPDCTVRTEMLSYSCLEIKLTHIWYCHTWMSNYW